MIFRRFGNMFYSTVKFSDEFFGTIVKEPYTSNNKWYISIIFDDVTCAKVTEYEHSFETQENVKLQKTIHDNVIVLKMPYRYNRFECKAYDNDGDPITCYELKEGSKVTVEIEHACFSNQDENILSTWKLKKIILHEGS